MILNKLKILLLQNRFAISFSHTLHKAFLSKENSSLYKWRAKPFFKGIWLRNSENSLMKFKKSSSPEPHPWVKAFQVCSNEGPRPFPRGDNYETVKIHWRNWKKFLLQNHGINFHQTWFKASLVEETQDFTNMDHSILKKEINVFFISSQCFDIIIALLKYLYWFKEELHPTYIIMLCKHWTSNYFRNACV